MKRSEAIKQLIKSLEEHPLLEDLRKDQLHEVFNQVLNSLEQMGMLPPSKSVKGYEHFYTSAELHKWEDEDETK